MAIARKICERGESKRRGILPATRGYSSADQCCRILQDCAQYSSWSNCSQVFKWQVLQDRRRRKSQQSCSTCQVPGAETPHVSGTSVVRAQCACLIGRELEFYLWIDEKFQVTNSSRLERWCPEQKHYHCYCHQICTISCSYGAHSGFVVGCQPQDVWRWQQWRWREWRGLGGTRESRRRWCMTLANIPYLLTVTQIKPFVELHKRQPKVLLWIWRGGSAW